MNFSVRVIHNTSVYDSRSVAEIFRKALRAHLMQARHYRLELVGGEHAYTKDGRTLGARGRATIGGSWMAMACRESMDDREFVRWLWTLDHEILHLKGMKHGEMGWHDALWCEACPEHPSMQGPRLPPEWARDVALPPRRVIRYVPPARDEREARIEHAEEMLARAQTRAKRAATIVAKWQRRLAALERARGRHQTPRLAAER